MQTDVFWWSKIYIWIILKTQIMMNLKHDSKKFFDRKILKIYAEWATSLAVSYVSV